MIRRLADAVAGFLLMAALTVNAQEADDSWAITFAPYLWGVSIDGQSQVGVLPPLEIDAGFDDLFSNLDMAASFHTEASVGRWTFVLDPTYINLNIDDAVSGPPGSADLDVGIWLVEAWTSYKITDHWELLGGLRWQDQSIDIEGTLNVPPPGPNAVNQNLSDESWTDFFAGFRASYDLSPKWLFVARADIGFVGDSDQSLNGVVSFNRYIGAKKTMLLNLGYRYFKNDFDRGAGPDAFRWDVSQQGPWVGYTWIFGGGERKVN
jgi:hypothetical protein